MLANYYKLGSISAKLLMRTPLAMKVPLFVRGDANPVILVLSILLIVEKALFPELEKTISPG